MSARRRAIRDFSETQHVGITKNPYVIAYAKDGKLAIKYDGR